MNGAIEAALAALEGNVLEIGSSGMHAAYSSKASVDVYEPSARRRRRIRNDNINAWVSALDTIPDKKYEAVVVPYVYEILDEKKAQELSSIIGARMAIGAPLIVVEHEKGGFFKKLFGKWSGTTIEDTDHGLKKVEEHSENGIRMRVYERVVLK